MVVTSASWILADQKPLRLPMTSVLHHSAICKERSIMFLYENTFTISSPNTYNALQNISNAEGSKWRLRKKARIDDMIASEKKIEQFNLSTDLRPLAQWMQQQRRIINYMGPRIVGV